MPRFDRKWITKRRRSGKPPPVFRKYKDEPKINYTINAANTQAPGNSGGNSTLPPDRLRFLEWLRQPPWLLVTLDPDRSGAVAWRIGDATRAARVVERDSDSNIYVVVNAVNPRLAKKPNRSDITLIEFAHVDLDPRDDETPAQAKARFDVLLARGVVPPPSAVIDTGNGYH